MDIAPFHLGHGHGGEGQHPVNKALQRRGHPVAVKGKAEQQHLAGKHLLQNTPHVVDDALLAASLAGEAAPAEFDVPVDDVNGPHLLGRGLPHPRQKGTGDVHGVTFLTLGTAVQNKNFHMRALPRFSSPPDSAAHQ